MSNPSKTKLKDKLIALFAISLIGLTTYFWFSPSGVKVVPNVELTTITGEKIQLASLRGNPVLVTFWATSCSGCIKEMPHLIEIHNTYSTRGLKVIGISMPYDRPDQVMKMAKQKALPYTIAMDINKKATHVFGDVKLTPSTFLIAPNGTIVRQKIGEFNMQLMVSHIEKLLVTPNSNNTRNLKPTNGVKDL